MLDAFLWGLLATSSLVLGGLIGSFIDLGKRTLGLIMAFGAGVLISAVAYELVFEAVSTGKGTGGPGLGLFLGALTFFFADRVIGRMGASDRKAIAPSSQSALVIPMLLGIILDGIPESMVIGLGILEGGSVSLAMLVAVFISNLPEAIAGTTGMRAGGSSSLKIFLLWVLLDGLVYELRALAHDGELGVRYLVQLWLVACGERLRTEPDAFARHAL
jgi:ZIP family zinc transporter